MVCTKAGGMRGQAHVVFRDVSTATVAMRALQNFMFLDKEMVCIPRSPDCLLSTYLLASLLLVEQG